jgi:hypothetical protein
MKHAKINSDECNNRTKLTKLSVSRVYQNS